MKQELLHQLNDTEQQQLQQINVELPKAQKAWMKASEAHAEQERQKQEAENRLTKNLLRRKEELEREISITQLGEEGAQIRTLEAQVGQVTRELETTTTKQKGTHSVDNLSWWELTKYVIKQNLRRNWMERKPGRTN